jgi:hypothetical protein
MIKNRHILILLLVLTIGAFGCGLFSSKTGDAEMVFAATEIGTPEGDKVTTDDAYGSARRFDGNGFVLHAAGHK